MIRINLLPHRALRRKALQRQFFVVSAGVEMMSRVPMGSNGGDISDKVLDSKVGALDRTLGFVFGLARGFLLVAIVFILFTALARDQPEWVRAARSFPILQQTQVAIESLLPMNPEQFLPGPKPEGEQQPGTQPEGQPETPAEGETQPDQKS